LNINDNIYLVFCSEMKQGRWEENYTDGCIRNKRTEKEWLKAEVQKLRGIRREYEGGKRLLSCWTYTVNTLDYWITELYPSSGILNDIREWTKSKNSANPSIIHHRQSHLEMTCSVKKVGNEKLEREMCME
jgi:hypothetical protein